MTKTELGEILGIIPKTIDRYESGQSIPSLELIVNFCQLFEISVDDLIDGSVY